MRFAHLYQKLYCEPLMLSQEAFTAFDHVLSAHISAGPAPVVRQVNPASTDAPLGDSLDFYRRARATAEQIRIEEVLRKYGPVAVVQVHGAIDRNLSRMEIDCYGACDLQDINAALADCDADPAIETVILDFDTPGGTCVGHAETADMIFGMRARKNMVAWVGGQCCSLGVYLASQCETVVLGTSAWFGSIGVRCARLDATANLKAQGLQVTLIASSDEKTDGSPAKPFTEAERQRMQARCDMLQADFMARVRAGRPGVSDDVMRAQVFFGREAIAAGLADAIAPSLDVVAADLLALSHVTATNPGGGGVFFDAGKAPRAEGGLPFEATVAPFQGGVSIGNPNHDSLGRFASSPNTGGGSGGSGGSPKQTPAPATPSARSQRAKAAHVYVGKDIQRYAEERNEPMFAKAIGGTHIPGNGPTDVELTSADGSLHGIELKTVVGNTNQKLTMKASAQKRKRAWERQTKGKMHTVVLDDTNVYNAKGPDQHDDDKRVYYYRRGVGSFRLGNMHPVASSDDVKKLIEMPSKQLPPLAKKR